MTRSSLQLSAALALLFGSPFLFGMGSANPVVVNDPLWVIQPDPPQMDQDLTIDYLGDDESVTIEIDGDDPAKFDVDRYGRIKISASRLKGKRYINLIATGGEEGFRVIRLP